MGGNLDNVFEAELALLRYETFNNSGIYFTNLEQLQRGDYKHFIEGDLIKQVFSSSGDINCDGSSPIEFLRNVVSSYLSKHFSASEQFDVLCIGVACMNAFLQSNWTGPEFHCPESLLSLLAPSIKKCFTDNVPRNNDLLECVRLVLSEDGEEIYDSILYPELLVVALAIFGSHMPELKTNDWWLLRGVYTQQQLIDEQSPSLLDQLEAITDKILNNNWLSEDKYLNILFHLEVARFYMLFGGISLSEKEIQNVLTLLKMDINVTGALGKRTYYQAKELAQLTINVKVDRDSELGEGFISPDVDFPTDILLNDDIRMPNISFSNPEDGSFPDLRPLEQATVLATYVLKKKSTPKDHLQSEELLPYISCLLSHPKVWSFQLSALHLRSRIESDHKRTVERSLLQIQTLMDTSTNKTHVHDRLHLFYCSYSPPLFVIAAECASILVTIGSIGSALDIFVDLKMWDEVIACYNFLKLRHKAAEIIHEQMKKGETVKLLCYLGDAIDDVSCYERAWELSNHRSAQAQRHWGMYYLHKKMYKECIEHFNLSLNINSLQITLWFHLGYANLMERRWEESAAAYRRYCALEPGSFEAWNNMAKAYILLGQKRRAYHALQEAIKCNFDTWQIWDNLMAVSSDCGEFGDVIFCYHRILDLKDKHTDEQILTVLTSVIVNNINDCRGQPTSLLRKKALELFGRITSKVLGNPTIWMLYAQLTSSIEEQTEITQSKVVNYYQKAYIAATQDNSWCKEVASMQKVLNVCEKLAEAHLVMAKSSGQATQSAQSLSSAKFSLANVIAKVTEQNEMMDKILITESFTNDLSSLQNTLENITNELSKLKT